MLRDVPARAGQNPFRILRAQKAADEREKIEPLTGVMKTRANAKQVYQEIVAELNACGDRDTLEIYLMTVSEPIQQFEDELPFLWEGDGLQFEGLQGEIRKAWRRVTAEW
jgi:hypothetical protein